MNKFLLAIKLSSDIVTNIFTKKKIILISEGANWVINEECKNIKNFLKFYNNTSVKISITPTGVKNKVIHFFSVNTFIDKNGIKNNKFPHNIHTSNKIILTWFHISEEDNYRLKYIPYLNDVVDFVHTASEITKNKLIEHGLNPEKIVLIPLGVDTTIFKPVSPEKKERSPHGSMWIIFIGGVPIKPATNTLPGLRYISSGVPICCKLPLSMMTIRSPRVSASVWS